MRCSQGVCSKARRLSYETSVTILGSYIKLDSQVSILMKDSWLVLELFIVYGRKDGVTLTRAQYE